jgi:hypothetical protein
MVHLRRRNRHLSALGLIFQEKAMKKTVIFILILLIASITYGQSCIKYKRSDYRHWIDADRDCQSTRNEVLIEESVVPVRFKTGSGCKVLSGKWVDPYTSRTFTSPRKLDVDHVVPLKEAHDSGAWQWGPEKKKHFANFLKHENHLIAVYASANRKKGARDPAEWLPSNQDFLKDYARIWAEIKVDWGLSADRAELKALKQILAGESITYPRQAPEYICAGNPFSAPASVVKSASGGVVKKSKNGICHDTSSWSYKRTKRFIAFESLEDCLDSGGRLPKR